MKLASLKEGGPDGSLIIVNRALTRAVPAALHAPTMRAALDDWPAVAGGLKVLAEELEAGQAANPFALDFAALTAPLPRAAQFLDASGYLNHIELARRARGDSLPDTLETDPLMYQGASEPLGGPRDAIYAADESWGIDFEAESAVITGNLAMGAGPEKAAEAVLLIMLVNDVSARRLVPAELEKGFGFIHGKPPSAFSAVAVTPDELGAAWDGARLHGRIVSTLNGDLIGDPLSRIARPRRQDAPARRRHHPRFRHRLQQRPRARLVLPLGAPHDRKSRQARAPHLADAFRRCHPYRHGGRRRPQHLRRH